MIRACVSRAVRCSFALPSLAAGVVAALTSACSGSAVETVATAVDSSHGNPGASFRADPHRSGRADVVHLAELAWGRLVDLYALDPAGEPALVARDLVVDPSADSDGVELVLERDPADGTAQLHVLHPAGSPAFARVRERLESGLIAVDQKGLDPGELPPFTAVARDGALVLRFDDLLDAASITAESLSVFVGEDLLEPHAARVFADAHHGGLADIDGDGTREFHPTRAVIDLAVSETEARASRTPVAAQPLGLPEATDASRPNLAVRVVARVDPTRGAWQAVAGAAGAPLAGADESGGVVRALRSMGARAGDSGNGYLTTNAPMRVVGAQNVQITQVSMLAPDLWSVDFLYATPACAAAVARRDVLDVGGGVLAVAVRASAPPVQGQISGAAFRSQPGATLQPGSALVRTPWDAAKGIPPACFVRLLPAPTSPPDQGLNPNTTFTIDFDQAVDPASFDPYETFSLTGAATSALERPAIGSLSTSVSVTSVTFTPSLPLAHAAGQAETYRLTLVGGPNGVRSLAGAPLAAALPSVDFALDPAAATQATGGFALHFRTLDEDALFPFPTPEVRGQFLFDAQATQLRPRPVVHFSSVADQSQPVVASMFNFGTGVATPLSPFGSKLMNSWRYDDLGIDLLDESTMNIDVEGLNWSPFPGSVVSDTFPEFQISLAHGHFLPDEYIDPAILLPQYPASGLIGTYASNLLDALTDPGTVVHPKSAGYIVDPADTFTAVTGTVMQPWPMNRNVPPDQFAYYTWRDTALQARAAPGGTGAQTAIHVSVTGQGVPGVPYPVDQVPSIGLPLLMEFRCYPNSTSLGLNSFHVAIAINSSAAPSFRAYSTGGVLSSGQTKLVDPDNEPVATGGVGSTGQPTPPLDNVFYYGQADFVVRVSRLCTIWMDTQSSQTTFQPVQVLPSAALQPAGTQMLVAFRGASAITPSPSGANLGSWANADNIDFYGDSVAAGPGQFSVAYLGGNPAFVANPAQLQGARYVQMRVSFVSNAATGGAPVLSSLALPFVR